MINKFIEQPFFNKLGKRQAGFLNIIEHLSNIKGISYIIETGTVRYEDNWEGDGHSTCIWDWCAEQNNDIKPISIDINPKNIETSKLQTKNIEYICKDSILALNNMNEEILSNTKLLYLDSYDWNMEEHLESSFHHMCELASIWSKLPKGCMVVVDDCHAINLGKHVMIQYFFAKMGKEPVFTGYQTGWMK